MNIMNAELCKKAAEKVGNPNVLVNLISRRVRQLNSGGGGLSRPLVADPAQPRRGGHRAARNPRGKNRLGNAGTGRTGPPAAQETPETLSSIRTIGRFSAARNCASSLFVQIFIS